MKTTTIWKGRFPYKEIQIPKKRAREYLNRGKLFGIQGKYKEAIAEYKKALNLEPSLKQAKTNLEFTYYMAGLSGLPDGFQKRP